MKSKLPITDDAPLSSSPFAGLSSLRDTLPRREVEEPTPSALTQATGPARAVLRLERKGHGGKEMTAVERLELAPELLDRWLKELKTAVGCGGVREGDRLLLQGDHRDRLEELLRQRGVRKVIRG